MKEIRITDIENFRIGNAQDIEGGTGCTVIICDEGASAGVSVLGGGPASRETNLLDSKMMCDRVHAIVLSGGSAYGLDSAGGVLKYLEEHGIGFDVGMGVVPIVPTSCLFDLIAADFKARPDAEMGYAACVDSEKRLEERENGDTPCSDDMHMGGNIGAGTGATVGKFMGLKRLMKSGLGSYAIQIGELKLGAVVAVNALGDVFDIDTGEEIAGMLNEARDGFENTCETMWKSVEQEKNVFTGNTTLGCVICNAKLDKARCNKLAEMTHDGYARTIKPVHTSADGDSVYFMAYGEVEVNQDALGDLAAYVMGRAINNAVRKAESAYGFVAAGDLNLK